MSLSTSDRFKAVLIQTSNLLFEEIFLLKEQGETNLDMDKIELIILTLNTVKSELILEKHLEKCSLNIWNEIVNRNEDFFKINLGSLFNLDQQEIKQISHLFNGTKDGNLLINSNIRNQIWNNLGALVRLSILYLHEKREPFITSQGQKGYRKTDYYPHLDIWSVINSWKIQVKNENIDSKWDIEEKLLF